MDSDQEEETIHPTRSVTDGMRAQARDEAAKRRKNAQDRAEEQERQRRRSAGWEPSFGSGGINYATMNDEQILNAGIGPGDGSILWKPAVPPESGMRMTMKLDPNYTPPSTVRSTRWIEARVHQLQDKDATPEEWFLFVAPFVWHEWYNFCHPDNGELCQRPLDPDILSKLPIPGRDAYRIPLYGETLTLIRCMPFDAIEKVRRFAVDKWYSDLYRAYNTEDLAEIRTSDGHAPFLHVGLFGYIANTCGVSLSTIREGNEDLDPSDERKREIVRAVKEIRQGGSSDLEWGDLFLRFHCVDDEQQVLRADAAFSSALRRKNFAVPKLEYHYFQLMADAVRDMRKEQWPLIGDKKHFLSLLTQSELLQVRAGLHQMSNARNEWLQTIHRRSRNYFQGADVNFPPLSPDEKRRLVIIGAWMDRSGQGVRHQIDNALQATGRVEQSGVMTFLHNKRGAKVSAATLDLVGRFLGAGQTAKNRFSEKGRIQHQEQIQQRALAQRAEDAIREHQEEINRMLEQLMTGRAAPLKRAHDVMHELADMMDEMAMEIDDEEEEEGKNKRKRY